MEEFVARVKMAFAPLFIDDGDPMSVRVGFATMQEARQAAAWLCRSAPIPRTNRWMPAPGSFQSPATTGSGFPDLATVREIASDAGGDADSDPSPPIATPLHDELLVALGESGWRVYSTNAPEALVDLLGTAAVYTCRYFAAEESRTLVCTTRCPVLVPEAARDRAMQFITRANFGMFYGSFELDLDDGMLLFRTNCAVHDGALTTEMVKHMASAGAWSFDRYLPRLMQVVFGKRRVRDAVNEADAS